MADQRLRKPPRERFAGSEHVFDLDTVFERLPSESVERNGHIQRAVYKHGRLTTAVFEFKKGATLDTHTLDGEAVVHVLKGRVDVRTSGESSTVHAGQILLLAPNVEHAIEASEPARLLMHIVLEREPAE